MDSEIHELSSSIKDREGRLRLLDIKILPAGRDAELTISTVKMIRWIASGAIGQVYEGRSKNGTRVAIKLILAPKRYPMVRAVDCAAREIDVAESPRMRGLPKTSAIVRMLAHGTLQHLKGLSEELLKEKDFGPVLIFEWCNAGDLDTLIGNIIRSRTFLPEGLIWSWLLQIVKVSNRLTCSFSVDGRPIVEMLHADLKPDNVFLTFPESDPQGLFTWPMLKVGDFGFAQPLISPNDCILSRTGNGPYVAPEWPYRCVKSELWEFVQIIYIMATFHAPARDRDLPEMNSDSDPFLMSWRYSEAMLTLRNATVKVWRIPEFYSNDLQAFFEYCLVEDIKKRPTPSEALRILHEVDAEGRATQFEPLPRGLFMTYADAQK